MQNIFSRKTVSFALALTLTAVTVLGAPITARAAGTEIKTGSVSETDKSENSYRYAEATPSDAKANDEATPSDAKENDESVSSDADSNAEATPSDAKTNAGAARSNAGSPKAAQLQTGKAVTAKAIVGETEYDTVQEAIDNAADGVSTTITMLADSEENLDITAQKIIVLNLAGHILSAESGDKPAIYNRGTLTVTDSAPTVPHYFDYDTDGSLVLNTTATEGVAPDEIGELPTVVKLSGGCITGGNNSTHGGGILNGIDSSLTVTGCSIAGNTAASGGGVYISCGSTAVLTDTVFFANTASGNGGALYLDSANVGDPAVPKVGQATLERVLLTGNRAKNGGAVEIYGFSCLLMKDCRVTANSASDNGGGIYKLNAGEKGVKCVLLNTEVTGNTAGANGGGIYFDHCGACFAAGTLITMADGSVRKIEDIAEGDLVKTFDHETGKTTSAEVYYAYKGDTQDIPFTLTFDDGRSLSIADCHDLLEKESRKYVTVSESNAESFVGSSFYGEDGKWHTLLSVAEESAPCDYYSIYTARQQNCFANGLLSVPDDVDCLLNLYELDEDLKAGEEKLASDIAAFGLFSFEDARKLRKVSRGWFDASGVRYLNIAIGKGLFTKEEALALFDSLNGAGEEEAKEAEKTEDGKFAKTASEVETFLSASLSLLGGLFVIPAYAEELSSAAPTPDDFNKHVLTIGKGTKITGNTAGTGEPETNNVYLPHSSTEDTLIELTEGSHEGICVGVTLQVPPTGLNPAVPFSTSGNHMSKADEAYFFSDSTDYADRFNSEKNCMELIFISCCYIDADKSGQFDSGDLCCKYVQDAVTEAGTTEQTVIRMTDDSKENVAIATGQDIVLDLNGHVLSAPVTGGSVIDNRGKLTVTDSDPAVPHYFDYSDTAAWTWNPAATSGDTLDEITGSTTSVKLLGGCITGGTGHSTGSYLGGGGIYEYGTALVLHAGNIVGNTADMGGGILTYHLTMDGGCIVGNKAGSQGGGIFGGNSSTLSISAGTVSHNLAGTYGGGIYNMLSLDLSGGSVSHNRAGSGGGIFNVYSLNLADVSITCNEADWGGGVYNGNGSSAKLSGNILIAGNRAAIEGGGVYNTITMTFPWTIPGTAFEMTGGKITGNAAPLGGGVTFGESITLGGTANITGNTHVDDAACDNLYLPSGKTVTISASTVPVAKDPADSSKPYMLIGVRTETEPAAGSPVAVTGTNGTDHHGSFTSDDTSYGIQNGPDNVVMLYLGLQMTSIVPIPDQTYTGSAIEPEVTVMSGTTVLMKDVDYTVSYENNIGVGTATVTVIAQGIYSGTKTAQFDIVSPRPEPPKPGPEPDPKPEEDITRGDEMNILVPKTTRIGTGTMDLPADGTWIRNSDGSWSFGNEGIPQFADTWAYIINRDKAGADWYYFGTDGKACTGFRTVDGKTYYFREIKDARECAMVTGWLLDETGSWYYLEKTKDQNCGAMQKGWMTDPDDGYRYYLDPGTGKMLTGRAVIDGKEYYFNETVPSASGWTQNANGDWVYSRQNVTPLGALIKE